MSAKYNTFTQAELLNQFRNFMDKHCIWEYFSHVYLMFQI
jgi:hypothetical protein